MFLLLLEIQDREMYVSASMFFKVWDFWFCSQAQNNESAEVKIKLFLGKEKLSLNLL